MVLINDIQPGPIGERSAGEGRQGSMKPAGVRRVRNMRKVNIEQAPWSRIG
jgi:hypothetical protein